MRELLARCNDRPEISDSDVVQLDLEIDSLLARIATKKSPKEAENLLMDLGAFQELLAILFFKYGFELTDRQRKIVQQYDRWDDEETRGEFFKDIVAGRV